MRLPSGERLLAYAWGQGPAHVECLSQAAEPQFWPWYLVSRDHQTRCLPIRRLCSLVCKMMRTRVVVESLRMISVPCITSKLGPL